MYIGSVFSESKKLASYGNLTYHDSTIMVSNFFHDNIVKHNQEVYGKYFEKNYNRKCYQSSFVNTKLNDWYDNNCK